MDRYGNASSKDLLTDIRTDLAEKGWEASADNGSDESRFAHMTVRLPNGQIFAVRVEEVI